MARSSFSDSLVGRRRGDPDIRPGHPLPRFTGRFSGELSQKVPPFPSRARCETKGVDVIVLGIVLVIIGALADIGILYTVGAILLVIGLVLWILGAMGRSVGGRAHYY